MGGHMRAVANALVFGRAPVFRLKLVVFIGEARSMKSAFKLGGRLIVVLAVCHEAVT